MFDNFICNVDQPNKVTYLTKPEARRLIDACVQPHVRLFVRLALQTAGRKSAVLGLTWDRVDFDHDRINLSIAGEANRKRRATVPMGGQLKAELYLAREASQTPYVIEYAGRQVLNIKKGFAAAVERS